MALEKEQEQFELTTQGRFYDLAPNRPYCTDHMGMLVIRGKDQAFKRRYVQYNPPAMCHWLILDLDHDDPFIWLAEGLPSPNYVAVTPYKNTSHAAYAISSVCTSESARRHPIEYLAAIEEAYRERLQADVGFAGLITKNPLHSDWNVQFCHDHVFELSELAAKVELKKRYWTRKRANDDIHAGLGRNCALFHRTRFWAYDNVHHYRDVLKGQYNDWMNMTLEHCDQFNSFNQNLPYSEVKSTAKSVGKWCWTKYFVQPRIRRGAMADMFSGSQLELDLKARQRLAARRSAEIKRSRTEENIIQAIGQLTAQGKKVSAAAIARLSGISRQALYKHYPQLLPSKKVST